MLQATVFALTVMGCSDHAVNCTDISRPTTTWQNKAECEAAIPKRLNGLLDAPYPVITARCESRGSVAIRRLPEMRVDQQAERPSEVVSVEPVIVIAEDLRPGAEAEREHSLAGAVIYRTKNGYALVRKGTLRSYETLRDGARTGISKLRGGVETAIGATVGLAKKSANSLRGIVEPQN